LPEEHVNWQPISALRMIGSLIEGMLAGAEEQYATLQECRSRPHALDNYTVTRVIEVYSEQASDLWIFEEQISGWRKLKLTPSQRQDVARLATRLPMIREQLTAILALAEELKGRTIDAVLAKSDLDLEIECALRNARKHRS
jgi:hypothetical protein